MQEMITVLSALLVASESFLTPENEAHQGALDSFMQNVGYPKPGDIPILNRKIFKGQRVTIREHPYVASVRRKLSHYVTAALLTKNLVITVAHPLADVPVTELSVVLGENYSDRGSMLYTVLLVIINENFDPYTLRADIALLRFYEEVSFKGNIKPIGLISPVASLNGLKAFVTGWGRCDNVGTELCLDRSSKYYPNEKMDHMLRTVTFTMKFPNYYCEGYKRHDVILFPGMLCTGVAREEDQVCPCLGVPGALLVATARLVGLLSWGFGCGYNYDLPLVYTDIQNFSSWIATNIKTIRVIKHKNLTALFKATKALILTQWLIETRIVTPKLNIRLDKNLEPLNVDYVLTKIRGSIYDVRDYISDGEFHAEKVIMYDNIRNDYQKVNRLKSTPKRLSYEVAPFIGNRTLQEIGFNKNDIMTTSSKGTLTYLVATVSSSELGYADADLEEDD